MTPPKKSAPKPPRAKPKNPSARPQKQQNSKLHPPGRHQTKLILPVSRKEAAERQKRKSRDAQLKAQAQAAAKKRKHAEESLDESATLENSSIAAAVEPVGRASAKPRFDRSTLPDLLPEDFLEDDDADSEDEALVEEERPRQPKKIKFAYEEKKPKDKRLGATTFRVAQVAKEGFAPKVSRTTVSAKASLQGSRKGQVRKPVASGFVVAKRARA